MLECRKCSKINCCCLKCERDVKAIIQQEKLEATGHVGDTPRLSADNNEEERP